MDSKSLNVDGISVIADRKPDGVAGKWPRDDRKQDEGAFID
ncbi:MAG TPA: hypothetical protein VIG80_05010 [Bacillaceae bacterium]